MRDVQTNVVGFHVLQGYVQWCHDNCLKQIHKGLIWFTNAMTLFTFCWPSVRYSKRERERHLKMSFCWIKRRMQSHTTWWNPIVPLLYSLEMSKFDDDVLYPFIFFLFLSLYLYIHPASICEIYSRIFFFLARVYNPQDHILWSIGSLILIIINT